MPSLSRRDLLRHLLLLPMAAQVDFEQLLWVPKPIVTVPSWPTWTLTPGLHLTAASTGGAMILAERLPWMPALSREAFGREALRIVPSWHLRPNVEQLIDVAWEEYIQPGARS